MKSYNIQVDQLQVALELEAQARLIDRDITLRVRRLEARHASVMRVERRCTLSAQGPRRARRLTMWAISNLS